MLYEISFEFDGECMVVVMIVVEWIFGCVILVVGGDDWVWFSDGFVVVIV